MVLPTIYVVPSAGTSVTADVALLKTTILLKSTSIGSIHPRET